MNELMERMPQVNEEPVNLEDYAKKVLDDYLSLASQAFERSIDLDNLRFDLRGKAAGQFVATLVNGDVLREIRLNAEMMKRIGAPFIDEVVPHECAHLVVFSLYGKKVKGKRIRPHGPEWRHVMADIFKREPRLYHSFEVKTKQSVSYEYLCACVGETHQLSKIRHNKVQRGVARYLCKRCETVLEYDG